MRPATARPTNESTSASGAAASGFASPELEEKLLQMNVAELTLPKVHNLNVDALKPTWIERLFGRR